MSKKAMLIINNKELTIPQLEQIKNEAIEEWRKTEEAIIKAERKRRDAESVIEACCGSIRLIKIAYREDE